MKHKNYALRKHEKTSSEVLKIDANLYCDLKPISTLLQYAMRVGNNGGTDRCIYPYNAVEVDSFPAVNRGAICNQPVNVAKKYPFPDTIQAREFTFVAARAEFVCVESSCGNALLYLGVSSQDAGGFVIV